MQCDGQWVLPGLAEALICIGSIWTPRSRCCLQVQLHAQLQVYREAQWTATAELSMCEVRHGHYMGYTITEDRLQEANQSEEPWSLKVGPDSTPHQPSCSGAF